MGDTGKKRVLVVDDSAIMRKLLSTVLDSDPRLEVVGTAVDPYAARDKIKKLNPDVITLDIEMPRMDGITFLRNLMRLHPMPVVMVSTLTTAGAEKTLEALELGAVDFITKPKPQEDLDLFATSLREKVVTAASAHTQSHSAAAGNQTLLPEFDSKIAARTLIAIGASTGGTEAIKHVLERLPPSCPGIVIAQHIPPVFSHSFAERMDRTTALTVKEAKDGDVVRPGHVYIAPGDYHMQIRVETQGLTCRMNQAPPVNFHRPSIDVMFQSIAESVRHRLVGAILTGMGKDGAAGLKEMREAGARTLAQDEESSVVWGMPRVAAEIGAAAETVALDRVGERILQLAVAP